MMLVCLCSGWSFLILAAATILKQNNIIPNPDFIIMIGLGPSLLFMIANLFLIVGLIHFHFVEEPKPRRKRKEKFKQAHLEIREPIEITKLT